MWDEISFGMNIIAFVISVVALGLYIRDKIQIEPVIQQFSVRRSDDQPPRHMIQALIGNIGEKKAKDCHVDLCVNGNKVSSLVVPQVDSPIGRVGVDWAIKDHFTISPKAPVWVRGWTEANLDDHIKVVLKQGDKEWDKREFSLRFTTDAVTH
jgi:hypothetical protein